MENKIDTVILEIEYRIKNKKMSQIEAIEFLEKTELQFYEKIFKLTKQFNNKYGEDELNRNFVISEIPGTGIAVEGGNFKKYELQKEIKLENNRLQRIRELLNKKRNDPEYRNENETAINNDQSKKIKWCDNSYLSLMGLIELLEESGLIPEKSFENSGAIASNNFLKRDSQCISRISFNAKKKEYEERKPDILGKLIDSLNEANKQIMNRK